MAPRKYIRKSTKSKKKNVKSYKKMARPSTRKKITRDPTITKLNAGKERIVRVRKMTKINLPSVVGTAGTNGMSIQLTSTGYTAKGVLVFDPSGSQGNNSGNISNLFTSGASLSPCNIPDWSGFQTLYSEYRVKKITCKFNWSSSGNPLSYAMPELYVRYANDYNEADPDAFTVSEQRNWVRKVFTMEHPSFTYSFYPKVMYLADNPGVLATEARVAKAMPWTDMSNPCALYGLKFFIHWPGAVNSTYTNVINMDISYDIEFKEQD